jgi:hypothetical protein
MSTSSACLCITGIKENHQGSAVVNIYPNPFAKNTTIQVTLEETTELIVDIRNTLGELVYSRKVHGNEGDNIIGIDGSEWNAGVYYCSVSAGDHKINKKLVLQK